MTDALGFLGAAATVGTTLYNNEIGFTSRHEQNYDSQVSLTQQIVEGFAKAHRDGDVDDEDHEAFIRLREKAVDAAKDYSKTILDYKRVPTYNIPAKVKWKKQVRTSKRELRQVNEELQSHYCSSLSGSCSDASSVAAQSGSPPGSGLEDERIREWTYDVRSSRSCTSLDGEQSSDIADFSSNTAELATEREMAQNQIIVMELSLDGDHIIWVNNAWRVVVGTEPDDLPGSPISSLLSPSDVSIFKEASQRFQEDDSHTIDVTFDLRIEPTLEHGLSAGTLYRHMEGNGMHVIDREDGQPSHTMWVIKPLAPARFVIPENDLAPEPASIRSSFIDQSDFEPVTPFPFSQPISEKPMLCRICECQIPQWYFEKHSETCAETHIFEAGIVECNESISELRNTFRELYVAVDRSSISNVIPTYRGMQIFSPSSNPLQFFRTMKFTWLLLARINEILQVALEISMPSLMEEEATEPIERQRLLSPGSEQKITQIRRWSKPNTEDAVLTQLIQDAEHIMRQKVDNVVRMQNIIRYSEKILHEWQERVE